MIRRNRPDTSNALQGDLLSGEWLPKPSRRGSGHHIRLKPLGADQRTVVPGMADFAGEGPDGTYCRDCNHFADEIAVQTRIDAVEKARAGCAKWAQRMAHAAPSPRRDIRLCRSCKHFERLTDNSDRCFIIDMAGVTYRCSSMPDDIRMWLRANGNGR